MGSPSPYMGGIVLCGGKSTRMETSKALLPFGSETMLQRVVRILGTVASPLVVVAAADQKLPDLPEQTLVARDERHERGPLEGLRAGLKTLPPATDIAYVTSCDVPLLVPAFVVRLHELLGDNDIAVVTRDGFAHSLSAVYRRRVLPRVEELLDADRLRPAFLFDLVKTRRVDASELADADPQLLTLRNLNTRQDYLEALSLAGLS